MNKTSRKNKCRKNKSRTCRNGLLLAVVAVHLSGCDTFFGKEGYFRDRGDDYLKAEAVAPVKLPQGMNSDAIGQLFVIPPITDADAPMPEDFEVPGPNDGNVAAAQPGEVKIQKLGERNWIAVNAAPSAVWPRVRSFLSERGLSLSVMDPSLGVLETDWLTIKEDPVNKDRYRLRLEQGLRSDSTEIHVLQMTVPQAVPGTGQINWPDRSVNPAREVWMVSELSGYLAKEDTGQASMLAQAIGSSERKVEWCSSTEAEACMLLQLDMARAWASVGGALNRPGFEAGTSNKEQGILSGSYSVQRAKNEAAAGDEDRPGLWSRFKAVFGFGNDKKSLSDEEVFTVVLQQEGDAVRVQVRDADGKALPQQRADKLLRLLRANLI